MAPLDAAQRASLTLWQLTNMSTASFAKLLAAFGTPAQALTKSTTDWQAAGVHASHIKRFGEFIQVGRVDKNIERICSQLACGEYQIVFYADSAYPASLKRLYDPPPLLFYQGNVQALAMPQLAIVGSRKPSAHADKIAFDMAQYLAYEGLWITSGMAEGIDKQAHLGALTQTDPTRQGRTVAVLGNGIRLCYPKHHTNLKQHIIASGGCVISEFLPDTPSTKYNFPLRNRLVAGLSLGALVVEAALKSGSLITANLANEQGKQVFAVPSHIDNVNAKGCHQLIRDGATLVDHPAQILEDLTVFQSPLTAQQAVSKPVTPQRAVQSTPNADIVPPLHAIPVSQPTTETPPSHQPTTTENPDLPTHLLGLLNQMDWVGQDMDALLAKSQTDIATLTGWLIELELMGFVMQQGGLYMRCRA